MGHSEMLLAVAGLDSKTVTDLTHSLASGDWSRFSASERIALAFARKQARDLTSITARDAKELVEHLGQGRALDLIWWACHCHYRMAIAEAFQLPLEQENVFDGFLATDRISEETSTAPEGVTLSSMR
jgi:hypothetical protein